MSDLGTWLDSTVTGPPDPPPVTWSDLPRDDKGHWTPAIKDLWGNPIKIEPF